MILATATAPPAGGAPLAQVVAATAAGILLTASLLVVGLRYRDGRMPLLEKAAAPFARLLRVPAWAALPVSLATGSLVLAGTGFYWDVSVHIDRGRDPGPFGTPAHYPILIGLFGIFAAGWLALVMARGDEARATGVRLTPTWTVPTSGLVMMTCGAFALVGFPLDDVWHTIFGQDVTLWGPTHLIMLTGAQLMIPTILALLVEGRAAGGSLVDTSPAMTAGRMRRLGASAIAVCGAGGVLAGLTVYQAEFGFGVPQYNLLFQPALLAFAGALALVVGRAVAGRGGALAAAAVNVGLSAWFTLFVAVIAGQLTPHFSTYLPAAICVEVAAAVARVRRTALFVVLAGVLVGTVGTVSEWGWTHVWMPIPWPAHFVPSAIGIGVVAGLCGALVGAFVAHSLAPSRVRRPIGSRSWVAGAAGAIGFAAVLAFCLPTHPPAGSDATIALTRVSPGRADATIAIHPASTVRAPDFVQQLSWQGHANSIQAVLGPVAPGVYRTARPLAIAGSWKSLIRIQQGRVRGDVPVYLPADPAIPAADVPARMVTTRAFVSDTRLMQRERKRDVPGWLWSTATSVVLAIIAVLLAIIGWGLNRVGMCASEGQAPPGARARARVGVRVAAAGAPR